MKTLSLFLSLGFLLTTACTPADKAVTDNDTRLRLQTKKSTGGSKTSNFKIGFFSLSALMMDKEVEAVELARLALGFDKGEKSQSVLTIQSEDETTLQGLLVLNSDSRSYSTNKGSFITQQKKTLNIIVNKAPSAEKSEILTVVGKGLRQSVDAAPKNSGTYINFNEKDFYLTVKSKDGYEEVLLVTLRSRGAVSGA
ncbi:MAG: hypothetical protein AAGB31_09415, partial [Bdellovibrio sp.]